MTDLTAAPTASTLASSVSDEIMLLPDTRSLHETKLSLNSHPFQSQSSGRLPVTSSSQEFSSHDKGRLLLDLNEKFSNQHGTRVAGLTLTDDLERNATNSPFLATIARPLRGGLGTSTINQPNGKHSTANGTQAARRKKKDDFRFYNPVKKIFS